MIETGSGTGEHIVHATGTLQRGHSSRAAADSSNT